MSSMNSEKQVILEGIYIKISSSKISMNGMALLLVKVAF